MRIITFIISAIMSVYAGAANWPTKAESSQQDYLLMSHCIGEMASESLVYDSDASQVSVSSLFKASMASHYQGNKLEGIRFAIVSKLKIESITVWVRRSLDGENLASVTLTKGEFAKGWNEVSFENPITIENQDYYLGITYQQSATCYVCSSVGNDIDGGLYVKSDSESWTDRSHDGLGVLSIEGVVKGDNLIRYDASIIKTEQSADSVKLGTPIALKGLMRNDGTRPFSKATLKVSAENMSPFEVELTFDNSLGYRDTVAYEVRYIPEVEGEMQNADLEIIYLDEGKDEWSENSTHQYSYTVKQHLFMRKLLLEYFTGEGCGNCPRVGWYIDDIIEEHPLRHRIITTEHHTYGTDWLSIADSRSYASYFGVDGAPWLLFDREPKSLMCPNWNEEEALWSVIAEYLEKPTSVYIEPRAAIQHDGSDLKVNVTVTGEKNSQFNLENPCITVFILQDNVASKHQYFYDDRNGTTQYLIGDQYIHHNVIRADQAKWGEPLTFDGDNFSYTCSFSLSEDSYSENLANMYVMAFISNYDSEDNTNCAVENAESYCLKYAEYDQPGSGVQYLDYLPALVDTRYFNLEGLEISKPAKGINIIVRRFSDGSVKTEKFIL